MNKSQYRKIYLLIIIFIAVIMPYSVFASNVYFETAHTKFFVGDTILIDTKIDSENQKINIVEGKIFLDYPTGSVLVKDISLSGSGFSLWPNKPTLSDNLKTISFVGGVPGGLKYQKASLFKIALDLKDAGQITLRSDDISVYLNDGKATKSTVSTKTLTIDILPKETGSKTVDDLGTLLSNDKTPPLPFKIMVGQDKSVFEGKKFLSFSTTDEQSGIKYYEVKEGNFPPTRSGDTYVLQDQHTSNSIIVTAYDAAGNTQESIYNPEHSYVKIIIIIALIIFSIITLVFIIKKIRK